MKYHVNWLPQTVDLWTDLNDRDAIRFAADLIDDQLATDPHICGESRDGSTRIMVEPPLAILFEIDSSNAVVYVLRVWRCGVRR